MSAAMIVLLCVLAVLAVQIRNLVVPPLNFPKNIPTIPFYVTFVPIFKEIDQLEIFNKYYRQKLEKYGAVKMYFGSRWNVLVTKPEYVAQMFKQNEVFEKSGNFEKIPQSVMSQYLGDQIISAGNDKWRKYRKIMTDSIKFPDLAPLEGNVKLLLQNLDNHLAVSKYVRVPDIIQRFSLANIGDCVIGCNLKDSAYGSTVHDRVIYLKRQIFRPAFMNFPSLDHIPFPSRQAARAEVKVFKNTLINEILVERNDSNVNRLGSKLAEGYENGEITKEQFMDNSIIALIAGHENPQILMTSILYMLAKHRDVQKRLREELRSYDDDDKINSPYLLGVVYETLRMYPPLGLLVNRITREDTRLGKDIEIPKGVYVGINSLFIQRDPTIWKDPDEFVPERWGTEEKEINAYYTLCKSKCHLTAFHGRSRACLGEKFALHETKLTVIRILEAYDFGLDPNWKERLTPMGPVWPVQLALRMSKI